MLPLKHGRQKGILAFKMVIERPFCDLRRAGDLIHADPRITLASKFDVGGVENAFACDSGRSGHSLSIGASYVY